MSEPVEPVVEETERPRSAGFVGPIVPMAPGPELARRNILTGLALLGVFLVLFAGTVAVALIYLAVVD